MNSRAALTASLLATLAGCGDSPLSTDASIARDARVLEVDARALDGAVISPDASPPPLDAGPTLTGCAAHDYLFCEDFESAAPGALPSGWVVGSGWMDGAPSVTDDEHHGGMRALHSAVAQSGQHRAEHSLAMLGAARGHHWGRVFYKVETPFFTPAAGSVVHNTMVGLLGSTECRVVDTVVSSTGAHQFLFNIPDDSCCVGSPYDYRSYDGEWHCAEWEINEAGQSYRFFFDGEEVTSIAVMYGTDMRAHIESFNTLALGWRNYQMATTPYQSYFDDLALDDTRIGCE